MLLLPRRSARESPVVPTQPVGLCSRVDGRWIIVGLLMLGSLGRGFIQSPIMAVTMATLPDQQVRLGAGMRGLLNSLGATFGSALAGLFLQQQIAVRTHALRENQQLASVEHADLTVRLHERLQRAGEDPFLLSVQTEAMCNRWLVQAATITAYHDMFLRTAALVLLTAVTILRVRQKRAS